MQALRLEPQLVISNQTGIPLQLMQLHRGRFSQSTAGVTPNPATFSGLPRASVPPAGKGAPGLRAAVASPDADPTSTLDLPTSKYRFFYLCSSPTVPGITLAMIPAQVDKQYSRGLYDLQLMQFG